MAKRIFNPKELEGINKARIAVGMPKLSFKKRDCVKCGKKFTSLGIHNRACDKCRKENDRIEAISPQEIERLSASRERKPFAKKINDGY